MWSHFPHCILHAHTPACLTAAIHRQALQHWRTTQRLTQRTAPSLKKPYSKTLQSLRRTWCGPCARRRSIASAGASANNGAAADANSAAADARPTFRGVRQPPPGPPRRQAGGGRPGAGGRGRAPPRPPPPPPKKNSSCPCLE
jgi:hypothetical protein